MELLKFPADLAATIENSPYPAICFTHLEPKNNAPQDRIFLPMPPGIEIADMMSYQQINLGIIGDVMRSTIQGAMSGKGPMEAMEGAITGFTSDAVAKAKSANLAAAASIYTRQRLKSEQYANVLDFSSKQIIAPNTNSTFNGSNIRSYNFKFKMVARSKAESETIKKIVKSFRTNMYPEANDLIQSYPGTWEISFVYGDGGEATNKNRFVPGLYRSYLTNFVSSYNNGNNMWHEDGAPVEVDIAMNFQEIKALTKKIVTDLEPA